MALEPPINVELAGVASELHVKHDGHVDHGYHVQSTAAASFGLGLYLRTNQRKGAPNVL